MIVALDLETTGLDNKTDKIIEVALVKFDPNSFEIIDEFSILINPGIDIPELISNITNIFNEDVIDAPYIDEVIEKIIEFIGDSPILGHNVFFDRDFLISAGIDLSKNICLDTFVLANFLLRYEKSLSLESLSKVFSLDLEGAHRALNDTMATIRLFKLLIGKLENLDSKQKDIFNYIVSKTDDSSFKYILDIYLDNKLKIIDKTKFEKIILSKFPEIKAYEPILKGEIQGADFRQIMSKMKGIELRENQEIMAKHVSDSLDSNLKLVIEAPTGVGKTFAYLLPSIIYSLKTGEQVYISTSTKALQDQLFYKDLENLKSNLSYDFSFSKLKGKRNYFGLATFLRFFDSEESFSREKTAFLLKIIYWLLESKSFELDELDYYGTEYLFLREINADDKITFSGLNLYEDREPAVIARRRSRNTNIVVINNNILFQDIDGDNNILGKVKNLILDESHNLEDVVTNSLKKGFSISDFEKTVSIIDNILIKNKYTIDNFHYKVDQIKFDLGVIFDIFTDYISKKVSNDSKYKSLLIKQDFFLDKVDNIDILTISKSIKLKITQLHDDLSLVPDEIFLKLNKEIQFIEYILDILNVVLNPESGKNYISIANQNDAKGTFLEYTILKPGDYLKDKLWSNLDTCILTSATLKTGQTFDYIKNILSLDKFEFYELKTDFDYSKQALLYIPNDLGSIKNNLSSIINFLYNFISIVKGRTLVLFTAFFAIKEVYTSLNIKLKNNNINLYAQSIGGGKHKLIDFYKESYENSVLLGTDTFWEGIDLSGENLKYLIIHKVPFMVPSDPIFQARSILFSNSFSDYSLPKAIIKLKQGFGRLIRTKTDSGIVVFLDDRIYSTSWGDILYSAFPQDIKKIKGNSSHLLDVLKK